MPSAAPEKGDVVEGVGPGAVEKAVVLTLVEIREDWDGGLGGVW